MNYVPNQNEKGLEEMIAGFNSDDVKKTCEKTCLCYFKMTLPRSKVLQKSLPIPLAPCHT